MLAFALDIPSSSSLMYIAPPIQPGSSCLLLQEVIANPSPRFSIPQVCSLALVLSTWVVLKQELTLRFLKPFPVQP